MKLVLKDLTSAERREYERKRAPLHPWTPYVDDRTGFALCRVCEDRELPWLQNKSLHAAYEIEEEIDFPWDR